MAYQEEIEILTNEIKKLRETISDKFINITQKKKEIENLQIKKELLIKQTRELEIKKRKKFEKYELVKKIQLGDEIATPDLEINKNDIFNFVPNTPAEGAEDILKGLIELKEVLGNDVKIKDKKDNIINHVNIKFKGQQVKYLYKEVQEYTFYELLQDVCLFFNIHNYSEYIFKDDVNYIWPLYSSIKEYYLKNDNELTLYLNNKLTNKTNEDNEEKDDNMKKKFDENGAVNKEIENFIKFNPNDSVDKTINDSDIVVKKKQNKFSRENEIILMIEKTFGKKILYLIFYIFFVVYISYIVLGKNNVETSAQLIDVLKYEYIKSTFPVNFSTYDYVTYTSNNTNIKNNLIDYRVDLSLENLQKFSVIKEWLKNILGPKLKFNTNLNNTSYDFIDKHKLFGKLRIIQLRQSIDKNCTPYSSLNDNITNLQELYCYGRYDNPSKTDLKVIYEKNHKSALTDKLIEQIKHQTNCALDNLNATPYVYREINKSYYYYGQFENYFIDGGYYYDLDISSMNATNFYEQLKFLDNPWLDLSTRLIILSFNAYLSTDIDNSIIAFNIYIEISSTQDIKLEIDVKLFKLFINFKKIIEKIKNADSILKKIQDSFDLIMDNFSSYLYLLSIFLYSAINLVSDIKYIYRERFSIVKKGFNRFIIGFAIDALIMTILILRIIFLIEQVSGLSEEEKNNFKCYFSVLYYTENYEKIINYVEISAIMLIVINLLNVFYIEFFSRIFLTFSKVLKYLISYLVFYMIIIISYSSACNLLYGNNISQFSTFLQSMSTMMTFVYSDFSLISKMMNYTKTITLIIIFSFYFIMYFITLNLFFVLLLDAYDKVKKTYVLTLLRYSIIWNGLKQFFYNLFLKFSKRLKIKELVNLEFLK